MELWWIHLFVFGRNLCCGCCVLMVLGRAAGQTSRMMFTSMPLDSQPDDHVHTEGLFTTMQGYAKRAEARFRENMKLKEQLDTETMDERAAFEKGFLMGEVIEAYRKALVFTEKQLIKGRYLETERIRFLLYVQNAYIKVFHLVHMMHEINAKYGADNTGQNMKINLAQDTYKQSWSYYETAGFNYAKELDAIRDKLVKERQKKVDREKQIRMLEAAYGKLALTPRTKKTTSWFPIQYGWDMDYYW